MYGKNENVSKLIITANPSRYDKNFLKMLHFSGILGAMLNLRNVAGNKKIRVIVIITEIRSGKEYAKLDCFT